MTQLPGRTTPTVRQIELLDFIQRAAFRYFLDFANSNNGLIADSTWPGAACSIAAVGLGLGCYAWGVERGLLARPEAIERIVTTLRFFRDSPQGPEPNATGHRGFYYHFLDMRTGERAPRSELSTIDSAHVLMGALYSAAYFDGDEAGEREIQALADALYRRADWQWALNGGLALSHGWFPDSGFIPYRWFGYDEAQFLYVLGLGSPEQALSPDSYAAWTSTFRWDKYYAMDYLHAGPLFIHQASHIWLDLRGVQDDFMRSHGIDYFENTRRATYVQQRHAMENSKRLDGYDEFTWGITASEGPGDYTLAVDGVERQFYGYRARGVPEPDDGTLSPWAVVASLPFASEIVLPTLEHYSRAYPGLLGQYGFTCSLNPSFRGASAERGQVTRGGWLSGFYYGLNQGPNVLMIENYRSDFTWRVMHRCPYLVTGLRRAGFRNGWLG